MITNNSDELIILIYFPLCQIMSSFLSSGFIGLTGMPIFQALKKHCPTISHVLPFFTSPPTIYEMSCPCHLYVMGTGILEKRREGEASAWQDWVGTPGNLNVFLCLSLASSPLYFSFLTLQ